MDGLPGTAKELPAVVSQFLGYTAGFSFQDKPDYDECLAMFQRATEAEVGEAAEPARKGRKKLPAAGGKVGRVGGARRERSPRRPPPPRTWRPRRGAAG